MWAHAGADDPGRRSRLVARAVTLAVTILFWLVATAWRPWRLFDRAGFSADFYDEQARAFLRGRLHVDPAVAGVEGFVIGDLTYLYYGPALALARLPTALLGRAFDGRLALVSMLVALVVLGTWAYRLLGIAGRLAGRSTAGPWRTALFVGGVMGSPVLFLAGWISVYHETELWACTFAVIAVTCMLELLHAHGRDASPPTRWLTGAGAATIACVLTRASVGFGVAAALVLVAVVLWRRDRRAAVGLSAAAMVGVVTHMTLNAVKFGSLLGLPAERQVLSLVDPDRAAWFAGNGGSFFSVRFLPTTLVQYLRPDAIRFERLVPGVRFGPLAPDLGPAPVESTTPASSIPVSATVLFVLGVVGLVWLLLRRRWDVVGLVAALGVGAVPSVAIGFVANRYLVDLLPMLVLPAAFGAHVVRWAAHRRLARAAVLVVLGWGVWVNASLATWTLGLKSPGFHELRARVDDVLFPAPQPGLIDVRPGLPVPRDGVVGIEPDCAGVYVAEQGTWVALERAGGRRVVRGTVEAGGEVMVAGSDWTISLENPGPAASLRLELDGREVAVLPVGRLQAGDPLSVVADPVTREFYAEAPERTVFFDPTLPGRDDAVMGIDLSPNGPSARPSLCRVLEARR